MIIQHKHSDLIRRTIEKDHYFETADGEEIIITSYSNYDEPSGEIGEREDRVVIGNKIYDKLSDDTREQIDEIINDNM